MLSNRPNLGIVVARASVKLRSEAYHSEIRSGLICHRVAGLATRHAAWSAPCILKKEKKESKKNTTRASIESLKSRFLP